MKVLIIVIGKIIGIIDWAKMSISDLGKPENGGPIFAEIAKTAFRRPQKSNTILIK